MSPTSPPFAPSRRRAITILGAVAGLPLLCAGDRAAGSATLFQWNGSSLGSPSRLLLYHWDRAEAARIVGRCAAEIERLERIFALYRSDSELARLNREGRLDAPSQELLALLGDCRHLSELSGGAFDITVQPLWNLYAAHFFAAASPPSTGPALRDIEGALRLVDWRLVDFSPLRVVLERPGMGLTLNGIAQGYVADRITNILQENGCSRILADLGRSEMRALGRHADGRPWRIGLADPRRPETVAVSLDLEDRALCTSGGYGTKFEASGRYHHLFDPATGASANRYIAVSVLAPAARIADGLSTALYVTPPERGPALVASFPAVSARLTLPDGSVQQVPV